jgi:hypothetical protein
MKRARRVWKLPRDPVTDVEKPVQTHRTDLDVFSSEDVTALVRAAATDQDAAIYLTAAFTGRAGGADLVAEAFADQSGRAEAGRAEPVGAGPPSAIT